MTTEYQRGKDDAREEYRAHCQPAYRWLAGSLYELDEHDYYRPVAEHDPDAVTPYMRGYADRWVEEERNDR